MRQRLLQGWARIVAHFVDAAEKANFTPDEINRRLRQLAETTVLDEFWITDEKGHAYLRHIDVDFKMTALARSTVTRRTRRVRYRIAISSLHRPYEGYCPLGLCSIKPISRLRRWDEFRCRFGSLADIALPGKFIR